METTEPGLVIDNKYELRREIDRGGVCVVFEAVHAFTGASVALKLLQRQFTGNDEAVARLLREARTMTRARHPNVVSVWDAGRCAQAGPYLAMELMEGRTLGGILAVRPRLSPRDVVCLGGELTDALTVVHGAGVLHRDVKPANIFISLSEAGREVVKLFDFGVAAAEEHHEPKLTRQGAIIGTPEYMAPEQLRGEDDKLGPWVDEYSLAVTLFEALTGKVPFEGNYAQILLAMESSPKIRFPEECADVPAPLREVVERALERDPKDRFGDLADFGSALRATVRPLPDQTSLLGLRRAPPTLPPSNGSRDSKTLIDVPVPARRKHPRAPYITPVRIIEAEDRHIDGRTEDISEGGLLVLGDRACEMEQVTVRFALPMSGKIVSVRAEPRWIQRARGAAIGLRFIELDPEACTEIRGYVTAMGGVS